MNIEAPATDSDVAKLTTSELWDEFYKLQACLQEIKRREIAEDTAPLSKFEPRILRWGGVSFAIAGVPVCFAALPVGLAVAVGGLAFAGWGEWRGYRERKQASQRSNLPIKARYQHIVQELHRRKDKRRRF